MRAVTFFALLLLACSSTESSSPGADAGPAKTGVDPNRAIRDASEEERRKICDYMASLRGGYKTLSCELSDGSVRVLENIGSNQEECLLYYQAKLTTCDETVTVAAFEPCLASEVRDLCVDREGSTRECTPLTGHCTAK